MYRIWIVALIVLAFAGGAHAQPTKIPILFDFDIGEDIDDTFALATILASPELDLRGITTVGHDPYKRAQMAARFVTAVGRKEIPVAAGIAAKPDKALAYWQVQYGNHAAVYFRDPKPAKITAPEFLYKHLKDSPGELTIVAVGPLTNVAKLLTEHPDAAKMIKKLVIMGGSVYRGYNDGSKPQPEYNIKADAKAAQTVFRSGIPLVVAPLDATAMVKLDKARQKKLFDAGSILTLSVQNMVQLWQEKNDPILYDPVAVALVYTEQFCTMENLAIDVDDKGFTKLVEAGKSNARVATAVKTDAFLDWLGNRLATAYPKALPTMRFINETKLVPRGNMPHRVHVFEDFETDIEKRWILSGRHELVNVPPGSKRACRATLTQDFDDRQGETKTMYNAIVFNPVPGPPMGKKPHLSFRYYLKGTDTIRVQIYSLTNGYHRCMMLKGLPEGKWQDANVDWSLARKPDGTGGPLSENERIDDIQFYIDPRAELIVDDIVLYDAADDKEMRPFPKNFLFSATFDSGKQGVHWPGSFEIVPKVGYFWNAAKSVPHPEKKDRKWLTVGLRGDRPIGDATHLSFRYKLEEAQKVTLKLNDVELSVPIENKSDWSAVTLDLDKLSQGALRKGTSVREVGFFIAPAAELWIDDLLLYEPGKK